MKISRVLCVGVALGLAACQGGGGTATTDAAKDPGAETVATIDGKNISRNLLDFYIKAASGGRDPAEIPAEQRKEALESLLRGFAVANQAGKDKVDQESEVAAQLELMRLEVLQRAVQAKYLKDKAPTEAELRAEYETQIAQMPKTEYRARHILVQTEEFAKVAIDRINKGAKFDDIAKRDSLDGSKERGGDLGWFTPQTMVKPFADAVMALKKGEMTQTPVQSQFGWHVIKLEDSRDVQPPPFEQVKDQLGNVVLAKKFKTYADDLKKTAKIENKL
jgi:peptidyl-prolyl cis-trans isomerase C